MTLTKEAITRSVFDRLDLSKAASVMAAVEAILAIIKKALEGGDKGRADPAGVTRVLETQR